MVMLFCVGLMMFLVLKARSAKGTYARIALPATKLLLCYACVLGTLADSNQLMLQGPFWFTLRIPLELLLRPWYMMQIDCLPKVLEWPASNETHGYVHHEMVMDLDRTVAVAGVCTVVSLSLLTLLMRLLYFCIASKAKAVRARNAEGVKFQQAGQYQSEATMNSQKLSESTEAHSEDTDYHVDHQESRWTAFGKHGLSAAAKTQLARYRFLFMHEEFLLYREVSKVIRRITIFAFWFMPVYLRTQVVPLRCLQLEHINLSVLIEHPDVVCGSVVHEELLTEWQFLWAIILYPTAWALIVLLSYRRKSEAATMEAVAFLNAGYKYGMYWWDVLMVGRSAASFLLMAVPGRILRIMSQMTLIAVVSLLENSVKPWSRSNNGVLRRASNMLSAGLILTAAIAAWEVQQRQNEPNIILNITAAIISFMAVACSLAGILLLTLNVVFDEFFAPLRVLLQNGAATGSWTRMLYVATAWLVGGLHELHLWRGEDGRWVMNHSQLSRLERSGLVMLLVDILEQCLTLRGQFRMRQVETVLLLAFQNAAQVRRGTVQNDFYTHGTAHHPLTFWGFPRCSSQDPDISPNFDLKVTLTELQTALEMVSNDIQSGDPEVMTHTKASISTTEKRRHDHDDEHFNSTEILIWDDDFGDIEGKVINHRQSQLMEHEDNMSQFQSKDLHLDEGLNTHDGQRHLLRKLENMVNDEVDILLTNFDELAQEHISYVTNALGKEAQVVKKDIEAGRALVSETAQWCEDPLPPYDRGDPEVSALALRKAEAARRAAILKDEVESQANKAEACLQAYMDKAQESMQSAVQGTSVKGKRLLKKELEEAQGKLNDFAVQLRMKVQECKTMPELPASPRGPMQRGPSAATAPEVESAEELSDHGYNISCFVAMCDKEAGAGAPTGPV